MATQKPKGTVTSERIDHKQTRSLYERHQAQVGTNETLAGADTETASGAEQTTAEDPKTTKERLRGRSADRAKRTPSPMEDEVPVSGKDYTQSRYAEGGKVRGDKSQRGSSGRKSAPPRSAAKKGASGAEKHQGADQTVSVDDLPVGSRIEIFQDEVRILAPIAGGAIRTFHGPRRQPTVDDGSKRSANESKQGFEAALEDMNKFARGEGQTLDTASPEEKQARARANEAGARGLTEGATIRPRAGRATKTHSGARGDSGARKGGGKTPTSAGKKTAGSTRKGGAKSKK
jgi:hypothetical protein